MLTRQYFQTSRAYGFAALLVVLLGGGPLQARDVSDGCEPFADFYRAFFQPVDGIDNPWFPLSPGTQFTFEGVADLGDEEPRILPRSNVFTVTDMTKIIDGVETLVVLDQDFATDEEGVQFLVEEELAFFAQDEDGNVWTLGEYPEEFEDGEFVGAPSTWIQGLEDGQGGILVLGRQHRGTEYLQGMALSIEFFDCGLVYSKERSVRVDQERFRNVVVIHERDPLDPEGGIQRKYYARNHGLVKIDAIDDPEGERLELVDTRILDRRELATVRRNVKRLEKDAYNSEDERVQSLYGMTEPAERLLPPGS